MPVTIGDNTTFSEVLQGSGIWSLLHVEQLFMVPLIEIGGLNEGVNDSVLAMFAGTVNA